MQFTTLTYAFLLCILAQNPAWSQSQTPPPESTLNHPLSQDTTGINWAFTLEEALDRAAATNRIVILKPVSFRSNRESDRLSPSSETQRAMSFVDSRVVDLLNRRFVPYYYDMDSLGELYDDEATKLAMQLYPDLRYLSSMPTPPLLFMTPEKKFLGYASNFLSGQELLEKLVQILDENPYYGQLSQAEKNQEDPIKKARTFLELRRLDDALETLEGQESSEAWFLRACIAREQQEWLEMKTAITRITDADLLDAITVENLLRHWNSKNLEAIKVKAAEVKPQNPRYQEAMYYLGLAHFHSGDSNRALEIWENAIQTNPKSAWACRLDLTRGLVKLNPNVYLSSRDKIPSLLGREYLCPNGSADLMR